MQENKRTCLIVEDNSLVARYFTILAESFGYEVCGVATESDEAIQMALELAPSVIVMDIWLLGPGDGIDAAQMIRGRVNTQIIYVTGLNRSRVADRIPKDDPSVVLYKPIMPRDLQRSMSV